MRNFEMHFDPIGPIAGFLVIVGSFLIGMALIGMAVTHADEIDGIPSANEATQLDTLYAHVQDIRTGVQEVTRLMNILCVDLARTRGMPEPAAVSYCEVSDVR